MDINSVAPKCPQCSAHVRQVKAGRSNDHQRFKCMFCGRRYMPGASERGYPDEMRAQAIALRMSGLKIREVARTIGVNHQTVVNWLSDANHSESMPAQSEGAPVPATSSYPETRAQSQDFAVKRRATIRDVAKRAGVCTATISSYCNNKGRIGQDTKKRIHAAMEELHYSPNALVHAIRQQRTGILGVLIFGLDGLDEKLRASLTPSILSGITEAADVAEHDLLIYTGWPNRQSRRTGLTFLNGHIDGLLWVAPEMNSPIMDRLSAAGFPVVALLSRHVPENIGYVNADNVAAIIDVVSHLIGLGHTRIAFLGPSHSSNFIDRRDGYRRGLALHSVPFDPLLERVISPDWSSQICQDAIDALFRLHDPPTAIIAADDDIAMTARKWILARGLSVPDDIAVTGFNGIVQIERLGLTTVRQPFREIGYIATQRLLAMLEGESVTRCRMTLSATLGLCDSTAAASYKLVGEHSEDENAPGQAV